MKQTDGRCPGTQLSRGERPILKWTWTERRTITTTNKSERNLIILQVNRNGKKLEELKLLIHDTHADIITIQETKLTPKAKTPKVHNFTTVRTDKLHKVESVLITLIRDNITLTTTDIPSTNNTHITSTASACTPHFRPWICGQTPPEWRNYWPDRRRSYIFTISLYHTLIR